MECLPLPEIKYLLGQSYCKETSFTPKDWTKEKPFLGHIASTALIVQDILGGKIERIHVPIEWQERIGYHCHYLNVLDNGELLDLTRARFPTTFSYQSLIEGKIGSLTEVGDIRKYLLKNEETQIHYSLLRRKFDSLLYCEPLYLDKIHQRLWELAFLEDAKCSKLRFACQVYDGDKLVTESVNGLMTQQFGQERFCALDGGRCIREGIESGTNSVIGDCGHSQIWALKNVFDMGYKPCDLPGLDFYEAGFNPKDFSPWWGRKEATYTCTYCENIFAIFGLDKTHGIFDKNWVTFYTRDSFYTSAPIALGQKQTWFFF